MIIICTYICTLELYQCILIISFLYQHDQFYDLKWSMFIITNVWFEIKLL